MRCRVMMLSNWFAENPWCWNVYSIKAYTQGVKYPESIFDIARRKYKVSVDIGSIQARLYMPNVLVLYFRAGTVPSLQDESPTAIKCALNKNERLSMGQDAYIRLHSTLEVAKLHVQLGSALLDLPLYYSERLLNPIVLQLQLCILIQMSRPFQPNTADEGMITLFICRYSRCARSALAFPMDDVFNTHSGHLKEWNKMEEVRVPEPGSKTCSPDTHFLNKHSMESRRTIITTAILLFCTNRGWLRRRKISIYWLKF